MPKDENSVLPHDVLALMGPQEASIFPLSKASIAIIFCKILATPF